MAQIGLFLAWSGLLNKTKRFTLGLVGFTKPDQALFLVYFWFALIHLRIGLVYFWIGLVYFLLGFVIVAGAGFTFGIVC